MSSDHHGVPDNVALAVTHYTPEEPDQPACDADVDATPGTVMWGTLNPQKVTCPECLALMTDRYRDDHDCRWPGGDCWCP